MVWAFMVARRPFPRLTIKLNLYMIRIIVSRIGNIFKPGKERRDNETVFDVFGFDLFLEGIREVDETTTHVLL